MPTDGTSGRPAFATDSAVVAREIVKQGLGIGVNMRETAAANPGIEQVLPDLPPIPVPIWIVRHRELHADRRIRLVIDLLVEAFTWLSCFPRDGRAAARELHEPALPRGIPVEGWESRTAV